jgi:hypothetical protein
MKKAPIVLLIVYLFFIGALLTGEVKCIIKAVNCNWQPIGKAEVIYTASAFTGVGMVVGYMDIEDK